MVEGSKGEGDRLPVEGSLDRLFRQNPAPSTWSIETKRVTHEDIQRARAVIRDGATPIAIHPEAYDAWVTAIKREQVREAQGEAMADEPDLTALLLTPQIHTDPDGHHWDDAGGEYRAATVDGEVTYVRAEGEK